MERFHIIEDAAAIIKRKGLLRQVKVYQRAGALYAGYAGGYVRLYANGGTSIPDLLWDDIDVGAVPASDGHGKLFLPGTRPLKAIEVAA